MPSLSNPIIMFEYISHKLLRWLTPFFLILLFFNNLLLISFSLYRWILILQIYFYLSALIGIKINVKMFSFPFYFCMTNAAILVGLYKAISGKQKAIWEPVRR
jgi:hypothetical protein